MLKTLPLLLLLSCNQLVKIADDSYYEKINAKSGADHLKIVFSHNINGETHPCGCRKFPLGGLPQAAGYFYEAKQSGPVVYVDTGDMLFPSPVIPETMKESVSFIAQKLVEAQEMQGLRYFVPGDQDFALGAKALGDISKTAKFAFLITNMKEDSPIKRKRWVELKAGGRNIILFGLLNPEVFSGEARALLQDPTQALKSALKEIENKEEPLKDKILIALTHGGVAFDKQLAADFKNLDWIIGAHSQSFLRESESVGKTQVVQGLSRNHYLGEISIPFNAKKKMNYRLVPIAEDLEKKYPDNPLIPWLAAYKSQLDSLHEKEQKRLVAESFTEGQKLGTYVSCSECHKPQTEFWQKTSHSIAWQTLEKAKAANNPQCISCHSLGFQKPEGFATTAEIVQGEELNEAKLKKYWEEVRSVFKNTGSIRSMAANERIDLAQKWMKIDSSHSVERNFANVQCLHCHDQNPEHPFDIDDSPKQADFSKNCLQCHTADQSPDWYDKDHNGLATTPNKTYLDAKIKEISCPKM